MVERAVGIRQSNHWSLSSFSCFEKILFTK